MRNLIWVALAVAIGVGAYLALDDSATDGGYELDTDGGAEAPEDPGATLEGTGTALTAESEADAVAGGSARLRGRVVDLAGAPVAGVSLELRTPTRPRWIAWRPTRYLEQMFEPPATATRPLATQTSGADGTFTFPRLDPRRSYTLRALPAAGRCGNERHLGQDDMHREITLVVSPGSPLAVRTVDADGAGIQAWVSASLPNDGVTKDRPVARNWRLPATRAGADGRLALAAVPDGELIFDVTLPGVGRRSGLKVTVPHEGEVVLALGDADGGGVRGTVTNTAGQPVSGAGVMVMAYPGESQNWQMRILRVAKTAADGSYSVGGIPEGRLQSVAVAADGYLYLPNATSTRPIGAGETLVVDATVYRGGILEGTVRDADGQPVANARLATGFAGTRYNATNPGVATASADGRYRMENVPLGAGRLAAWAPGHYTTPPEGRHRNYWFIANVGVPFELADEGQTIQVDIALAPSVPIGGRVVDAEGTPVAGVHVEAKGSLQQAVLHFDPIGLSAVTDDEGRFALAGLPPGSWRLETATSVGISEPFNVAVKAGAETPDIEIVLRPGGSVAGRVEVEGRPPAEPLNVQLSLRAQRPAYGASNRSATTKPDGSFLFEDVAAGEYEAFVTAQFSQTVGERTAVTVAWGARTEDVVVIGADVGSIRGMVVDPQGKPLGGVNVMLEYVHDNMNASWQNASGPDGRFQFDSLPAGKYALYVTGTKEKVVAEPGTHDLRLVHRKGDALVIEGKVLAPDGTPVAAGQLMVFFVKGSGSTGTGTMISGGTFRFDGVRTDGKISLQVSAPSDSAGRPLRTRPFLIEDYQPDGEPLTIQLEEGLRIAGRVVDDTGAPVEGIRLRVNAKRTGENRHLWHHMFRIEPVVTDAEGRFEAVGLGEGMHTLEFQQAGDWIADPSSVEAAAGARDVELVVTRGVRITGRVLGPEGEAIVGAQVYWRQNRPKGTRAWTPKRGRATTDAEGAYEIRGIPKDALGTVSVNAPSGSTNPYLAASRKDVPTGATGVDFTLDLGVFIEGTVTGPEGEPVGDLHVNARPVSKESGRRRVSTWVRAGSTTFRLGPMAPGLYKLSAGASGEYKRPEPIEVRAPAADVKIVVPRGNPVRGTLQGDDVAGFDIWFGYRPERGGWSARQARVRSDGSFLISLADDVTGVIYAYKDGDTRYAFVEDVRPAAGPVTVRLQQGKRIAGRVENLDPDAKTRFNGEFVAQVTLRHESGFQRSALVAKDGTFEATGLPDGTFSASVRQGRRRAKSVDAEAGTTGLVLRLVER
ncbi:MAG: carboxypeptidase regulatory-like domain-containing protein [Planctomycetota bacterium]|nr:carboxypeptidase regulatory-like domain-containing protein [Planctomycetota bacterium]